MSIDTSIEYSMKASIFEIFEESIGMSVSTGYDWSQAGSQVYNEQETIEVKASVRPGFILQIQQAQGKCGGNDIHTELFKIIHIDATKNVIDKVEYEMTFVNGTTVKVDAPDLKLGTYLEPRKNPFQKIPKVSLKNDAVYQMPDKTFV